MSCGSEDGRKVVAPGEKNFLQGTIGRRKMRTTTAALAARRSTTGALLLAT
jgi:hypothetical protein